MPDRKRTWSECGKWMDEHGGQISKTDAGYPCVEYSNRCQFFRASGAESVFWAICTAMDECERIDARDKAAEEEKTRLLKLHDTFDALDWAREFVKLHGGDEGLMLSWFANAIMTGHDKGRQWMRDALVKELSEDGSVLAWGDGTKHPVNSAYASEYWRGYSAALRRCIIQLKSS